MILTVPADEIRSSLTGALKVFKRDPKALSYFNLTPDGFYRSFQAIIIIMVPFMVELLAQRHWLMNAHDLTLDTFPSGHFFSVKIASIGIEWIGIPALLWLAADPLDFKGRFGPYVIIRNWVSVIVAWIVVVPTLAYLGGLISLEVLSFSRLLLIGMVLVYSYRVARAALDKPPLFCVALIFAEFIVGLVVAETIRQVVGPVLVAG